MHKIFHVLAFLPIILPLAGCKPPELQGMALFQQTPRQPSYAESVTRGYGLLAQYEAYYAGDPVTAARFRAKSEQGAGAVPDNPSSVAGLSEADRREMVTAYNMLVRMLAEGGGSNAHGLEMAEAQVNFDCWLGRAAAAQTVAGLSTAPWCRERFYAAMEQFAQTGPKHYAIHFGNGEAVPDSEAFAVIRQAAAAFAAHEGDSWRIRLTGHSDPAGNREQNMILSMRRALAVRNALAQNGVDPARITIAAVGAPRKKNAASDPEEDRRVDIAIIPPSLDRGDKGDPDITKLMPQYFGPDGLNF